MQTAKQTPLEFECDLPDAPEKVWRALTVPELFAAWMMPNDIKPETGSRFAFAGPDAPIECEVLDAEPGAPAALFLARAASDADAGRIRWTASSPSHSPAPFPAARICASSMTALSRRQRLLLPWRAPAAGSRCAHDKPKPPVAANAPRLLMRAA